MALRMNSQQPLLNNQKIGFKPIQKKTPEAPESGATTKERKQREADLKNPGDYCVQAQVANGKIVRYCVIFINCHGEKDSVFISDPKQLDGVDEITY